MLRMMKVIVSKHKVYRLGKGEQEADSNDESPPSRDEPALET